ncbi:MAG TPA: hypothetical protein VKK31_20095 [Thermoanaerobaculia bacterium]|nr:hypothetical protein [Thermoanaerobaculia bacterium]
MATSTNSASIPKGASRRCTTSSRRISARLNFSMLEGAAMTHSSRGRRVAGVPGARRTPM